MNSFMALLSIRKIPDEILNKNCRSVITFDKRLHLLIDDMWETLRSMNGVGLAACQVGILKRVAVIDTGEKKIEIINPVVIKVSKSYELAEEGCLSLPGQTCMIRRPKKITVKAFDRNGMEFEFMGEELMARAVCHEVDHLNGVTINKMAEPKAI